MLNGLKDPADTMDHASQQAPPASMANGSPKTAPPYVGPSPSCLLRVLDLPEPYTGLLVGLFIFSSYFHGRDVRGERAKKLNQRAAPTSLSPALFRLLSCRCVTTTTKITTPRPITRPGDTFQLCCLTSPRLQQRSLPDGCR